MSNIIDAVNKARELFKFNEVVGNIFEYITNTINYIDEYKILIFKEDIGRLSGFIGYPNEELAVICVNYKRPLGHQNFTFAHELGHYIMHRGQNIDDGNEYQYSKEKVEKEANEFANELLYPKILFDSDYKNNIENIIIDKNISYTKLSDEINNLCHKYCISFDFVLRKICYKANKNYKDLKKNIDKSIGNISSCYDSDFYKVNEENEYYKQYKYPYNILKQNVKELLERNEISYPTAECILYTNGIDGD